MGSQRCPKCQGQGYTPYEPGQLGKLAPCSRCNGTGLVYVPDPTPGGDDGPVQRDPDGGDGVVHVEDSAEAPRKRNAKELDYDFAPIPAGLAGLLVAGLGLTSNVAAPWIIWPVLGLAVFFGLRWFLRDNLPVARVLRYGFAVVLGCVAVVLALLAVAFVT